LNFVKIKSIKKIIKIENIKINTFVKDVKEVKKLIVDFELISFSINISIEMYIRTKRKVYKIPIRNF
jgi:hypothetical protein